MSSLGFNADSFVKGSKDYKEYKLDNIPVAAEVVEKPKRKKKESKEGSTSIAPPAPVQSTVNLLQSDASYMTAYQETNEQ